VGSWLEVRFSIPYEGDEDSDDQDDDEESDDEESDDGEEVEDDESEEEEVPRAKKGDQKRQIQQMKPLKSNSITKCQFEIMNKLFIHYCYNK
jgi:hypothetical protein